MSKKGKNRGKEAPEAVPEVAPKVDPFEELIRHRREAKDAQNWRRVRRKELLDELNGTG